MLISNSTQYGSYFGLQHPYKLLKMNKQSIETYVFKIGENVKSI